jgi:hypothetical protein
MRPVPLNEVPDGVISAPTEYGPGESAASTQDTSVPPDTQIILGKATTRSMPHEDSWPVIAGVFPPGGKVHFDRYGTWIGYTPGPLTPQLSHIDPVPPSDPAVHRSMDEVD